MYTYTYTLNNIYVYSSTVIPFKFNAKHELKNVDKTSANGYKNESLSYQKAT